MENFCVFIMIRIIYRKNRHDIWTELNMENEVYNVSGLYNKFFFIFYGFYGIYFGTLESINYTWGNEHFEFRLGIWRLIYISVYKVVAFQHW